MTEESAPSVPGYDREAEVAALWDADQTTAGDIWRRLKEGKTQQQIAEEDGITIGPVYGAINLHTARPFAVATPRAWHEHFVDQLTDGAHAHTDEPAARDLDTVLAAQRLVDPRRGVTLLARCGLISDQPRIDQCPPLTQHRRWPTLRPLASRRQRRLQRLPDRPPAHPVLPSQRMR